jgi:hypothetical protein
VVLVDTAESVGLPVVVDAVKALRPVTVSPTNRS